MTQQILKLTERLKPFIYAVLQAKAWFETVHPVVTGYQRAILKELQATDADTGEPITEPENSYLLSDDQHVLYLAHCDEEAARNDLIHKPDCCPLLEAESMERDAIRYFCQEVLPLLPGYEAIRYEDLCIFSKDQNGKDKRDQYGRFILVKDIVTDLALKILVPQMSKADLKNLHSK